MAMLFVLPANALDTSTGTAITPPQRASAYISGYIADTCALNNGNIAVAFTIIGSGRMDSLGATSISLYEISSGRITRVARYSQTTNPELSANNMTAYGTEIIFSNAVSGRQYYAVVELFASKGGGSDSRTYTTANVTAK